MCVCVCVYVVSCSVLLLRPLLHAYCGWVVLSLFLSLCIHDCVCVCLYKATVTFHWWSIMGNWSTICFCRTRQSWRSLYITWRSSYIHEVTYCVCAVYWLAISPCVCHCSSIPPPRLGIEVITWSDQNGCICGFDLWNWVWCVHDCVCVSLLWIPTVLQLELHELQNLHVLDGH